MILSLKDPKTDQWHNDTHDTSFGKFHRPRVPAGWLKNHVSCVMCVIASLHIRPSVKNAWFWTKHDNRVSLVKKRLKTARKQQSPSGSSNKASIIILQFTKHFSTVETKAALQNTTHCGNNVEPQRQHDTVVWSRWSANAIGSGLLLVLEHSPPCFDMFQFSF